MQSSATVIVKRIIVLLASIASLVFLFGILNGSQQLWQASAAASCLLWTVSLRFHSQFAMYQFTGWVFTVFIAGMIYPQAFGKYGNIELQNSQLVLLMIQLVMFGMGTQMSIRDFTGVLKSPYGIVVSLCCQFLIMPLSGWLIIRTFHFDPEVAAGIILIGSCSSGLASNLMSYLAKADVGLSITMTAFATMLAPFLTPLWMKILAGELIEVEVQKMMLEIIKLVLVPIVAGLIDDLMKNYGKRGRIICWIGTITGCVWLILRYQTGNSIFEIMTDKWKLNFHLEMLSLHYKLDCGIILLESFDNFSWAILLGLIYHFLLKVIPVIHKYMPVLSMFGIIYVVLITTVKGRDNLLHIGWTLFIAVAIHNFLGYLLGYWLSRLLGMDEKSARTISFEVGMQNGGMAAGLAQNMGKMATVGLAAAIFAFWMNISGSILANYWGRKPCDHEKNTNMTTG